MGVATGVGMSMQVNNASTCAPSVTHARRAPNKWLITSTDSLVVPRHLSRVYRLHSSNGWRHCASSVSASEPERRRHGADCPCLAATSAVADPSGVGTPIPAPRQSCSNIHNAARPGTTCTATTLLTPAPPPILICKAERQRLLTWKVSSHCLLTTRGRFAYHISGSTGANTSDDSMPGRHTKRCANAMPTPNYIPLRGGIWSSGIELQQLVGICWCRVGTRPGTDLLRGVPPLVW